MAKNLPPKVTLDDLLRLKRAECPSTEFWTRFEEELRAKQLAALVQRRPWWADAGLRLRTSFTRFGLPLGAATTLALAGLVFRAYQPVTGGLAVISPLKQGAGLVPSGPSRLIPQLTTPMPVAVASVPAPAMTQPQVAPKPVEQLGTTQAGPLITDVPLTPWTTSISADHAQQVMLGSNADFTNAALPVTDLPAVALGTTTTAVVNTVVSSAETTSSGSEPQPLSDLSRPALLLALIPRADAPPLVLSAEAQASEQVSHRLSNELLHSATRHMVGFDSGAVTVRF